MRFYENILILETIQNNSELHRLSGKDVVCSIEKFSS